MSTIKLFGGKLLVPVEAFPLIAVVAGACGMAAIVGSRTIMYHNDVM